MKNKLLITLSAIFLPGILLYLAWPPKFLWPLVFVALVPLFYYEKKNNPKKLPFFGVTYFSMLFFNILVSWWVGYASVGGAIAMLLANSLIMTVPFTTYRFTKRQFGSKKAFLVFISFWMSFEYVHFIWDINWPWLSLGNVFANATYTIQWYEYTGVLGGSLWVLIINLLVYLAILAPKTSKWIKIAGIVVTPIIISLIIENNINDENDKTSSNLSTCIIVQPNIDPYEKFNRATDISNVKLFLAQAETKIDATTTLILLPETAISEYTDEDNLEGSGSIKVINNFLENYPNITLISGISSYNFYEEGETPSETARKSGNGEYYESFNAAIRFKHGEEPELYHKSKLVPGVEKMPYPKIFGFLEYFSIDMGGVTGSLCKAKEAKNFDVNDFKVAPLICYESIFPDYVNDFSLKGANVLLIITNDGWWRDTDGYKQHLVYAKIRAIENRKQLLRSANTGVSAVISKKGEILQQTKWWVPDVITATIKPNDTVTFYAKNGDYLGRFFSFIGIFLLLGAWVKSKTNK